MCSLVLCARKTFKPGFKSKPEEANLPSKVAPGFHTGMS